MQKSSKPVAKPVLAKEARSPVQLAKRTVTEKSPRAAGHGHFFTVQVKAVTEKRGSRQILSRASSPRFEPNVVLADIPEKGRYYRIRLGKFASMDEARRFQRQIRGEEYRRR